MTASGGNLIGAEVIRNKRSVQWTVAPIEDAEEHSQDDPHPAGFTSYLFPAECIDILFLHTPIPHFFKRPTLARAPVFLCQEGKK